MEKVRALIDFNDYEAGIFRIAGKEFECTEERAKVLAGDNDLKRVYAEILSKGNVSRETESEIVYPKEGETLDLSVNFKPTKKKKKIDTVE